VLPVVNVACVQHCLERLLLRRHIIHRLAPMTVPRLLQLSSGMSSIHLVRLLLQALNTEFI